uniref:Uncharacterized protein n=1 Tax=Rhizoctonia cerealis bunyavirus TaxID=3068840 RepID=A0AA51GH41_9VIRU|nr:MAG: hypothetical protein [Rhizoctonia cerealis bunyavirus]
MTFTLQSPLLKLIEMVFTTFSEARQTIKQGGVEALLKVYDSRGVARDPAQIKSEAQNNVLNALNKLKLFTKESKSSTAPSGDATMTPVTKDGEFQDVPSVEQKLSEKAVQGLAALMIRHGVVNDKHFYFIIASGGKGYYYAGCPELKDLPGGQLSTAFADDIGQALAQGKETAVSAFFKSKVGQVEESLRPYLFTKGVHVSTFPQDKEKRGLWKHDIDLLMEGMKLRLKADQVWTGKGNLKFFKTTGGAVQTTASDI